IEEQAPSMFDMLQGSGMEQMGMNMQDAFSQLMPSKKKKRKLPVKEARKVLIQQEAQKMIDMDEAQQEAVYRAEQTGIVLIADIYKVAGKGQESGCGTRESVLRDTVPIVGSSIVITKYGAVQSDHTLFLAGGALHMARPSDLIPDVQCRCHVRVEFAKLAVD